VLAVLSGFAHGSTCSNPIGSGGNENEEVDWTRHDHDGNKGVQCDREDLPSCSSGSYRRGNGLGVRCSHLKRSRFGSGSVISLIVHSYSTASVIVVLRIRKSEGNC
jgi:hypothetical protein